MLKLRPCSNGTELESAHAQVAQSWSSPMPQQCGVGVAQLSNGARLQEVELNVPESRRLKRVRPIRQQLLRTILFSIIAAEMAPPN